MTLQVRDKNQYHVGNYPIEGRDHPYEKSLANAATYDIYYRLTIKIILSLIELILFFVIIKSISSDISKEIQENLKRENAESEKCRQDYELNKCKNTNDLPPSMKGYCEAWKICSDTAPSGIGKTKAAVRVIAQLINELVNPLSPKAITVFVMIIIAWIIITKGN